MFIMLVVVSIVIANTDAPQLEPVRKQIRHVVLFIMYTLPAPEPPRPAYHCDSPEDAASHILNCDESTVILENKQTTLEIDIDSTKEGCLVTFTMLRCANPSFVDKSMMCHCRKDVKELRSLYELISNPKVYREIASLEGLKYCEGSLKDKCFEGHYWIRDLSF